MKHLTILLILSIIFSINSFGQFKTNKPKYKVSNCLKVKSEKVAVYSSMGILATTFAINETLIRRENYKPTLPIYFIGVGISVVNYYLLKNVKVRNNLICIR